jgi:peptide/nickel transport system permease protein
VAAYVLRRLATALPILLGVTLVTYVLVNAAPGNPVDALIDPAAGEQVREAKRVELGLDQPVWVRYGLWLEEVVRGNLGYSYADYRPVAEKIADRIGPTTLLATAALVIAYVVGLFFGIVSALRPYSKIDIGASVLGMLGISIPSFFAGLALIWLFALRLRILPAGGMLTTGSALAPIDLLQHLLLPAFTLSLFDLALVVRYTRASMLEVLDQDYVRTAHSKGLSRRAVLITHALRNALNPLITQLGLALPRTLGGAVVIETVFQWPGLGNLAIQAILQRDYPVIMGLNLLVAILVLVGSLLADLLYALADPRIRNMSRAAQRA